MKNSKFSINWELGCCLPFDEWAWLNSTGVFEDPSLRRYVAPFPPTDLMYNVSGLESENDFAKHGVDIYQALEEASPKAIAEFESILDFGCGCGRLARMFKGHPHRVTGCDVDDRHIGWLSENLNYMSSVLTKTEPPLPFDDNEFDTVISISVFTHLSEKSQRNFLAELYRITKPQGYLFLTIHGSRAMERAKKEERIYEMLALERLSFERACEKFSKDRYAFILQHGHLTKIAVPQQDKDKNSNDNLLSNLYKRITGRREKNCNLRERNYYYGITFIPENYLGIVWKNFFEIIAIREGAIHDFQDIVVLTPKK